MTSSSTCRRSRRRRSWTCWNAPMWWASHWETEITKGKATGQRAIQVLVNQKLPTEFLSADAMVEPQIGKYATDVIDVGDIFAQAIDVVTPTEPRTRGKNNGTGGARFRRRRWETRSRPPRRSSTRRPRSPTARRRRSSDSGCRPVMGGFSVGHPAVTAGRSPPAARARARSRACVPVLHPQQQPRARNSNSAHLGDPILQPGVYDGGTLPRT